MTESSVLRIVRKEDIEWKKRSINKINFEKFLS